MKSIGNAIVNVSLKDDPDKVAAFFEKLRARGINVGGGTRVRGSAQAAQEVHEAGPWEQAWLKHSGFTRLRKSAGRNHEQQAYHNFQTYAPEARPKGLRAPKS